MSKQAAGGRQAVKGLFFMSVSMMKSKAFAIPSAGLQVSKGKCLWYV